MHGLRKILLAATLIFLGSTAWAAQDREGSMRPSAWRSSVTCVPETHVLFSTRSIFVHEVRVASATLHPAPAIAEMGRFALFNTTIPPTAANFVAQSSWCFTITSVAQTQSVNSIPPFYPDQIFLAGATLNKTDSACVEISWDFLSAIYDPYYPWRP